MEEFFFFFLKDTRFLKKRTFWANFRIWLDKRKKKKEREREKNSQISKLTIILLFSFLNYVWKFQLFASKTDTCQEVCFAKEFEVGEKFGFLFENIQVIKTISATNSLIWLPRLASQKVYFSPASHYFTEK